MLQMFKKYYLEIIGSVVIGLIVYGWFNYPAWIESKDESLPVKQEVVSQQVPKLTFDALFKQETAFIPYKLSSTQELSTAIEPSPTKFQAIGEKYGTFGDTYGALNTLFSGLAFAVLIITMLMQRQELKEQRKELAQQRDEVKKSNKIADKQREIAEQQGDLIKQQFNESRVQNFYMILFQYLKDLDNHIEKLQSYDTHNNRIESQQIFTIFSNKFIDHLDKIHQPRKKMEIISSDPLKIIYSEMVNSYNIDLNQTLYVENVLIIIKFIEDNKDIINIKQPINSFLSHLSGESLLCLTWVALVKNPNLKLMIENYGLLRNLNRYLEQEFVNQLKIVINEKAFREI